MSRAPLRDDLALAAYAVSLGYSIRLYPGSGFDEETGLPDHSLQFNFGRTDVWNTQRGWRVADLNSGLYEKPVPEQFYSKLKDALDAGVRKGGR